MIISFITLDGSTFFQPGEADIWRQYHSSSFLSDNQAMDQNESSTRNPSDFQIEILTPHGKLHGVDIYVQDLSIQGDYPEEISKTKSHQNHWSKSIYLSRMIIFICNNYLIFRSISTFACETSCNLKNFNI